MAVSKSESDVILNRANVALARSQRLVASWLPVQTEDELAHTKSEEELQREEDEIFTAVPETLGVGAPLPEKAADGSWNRTELSSNDKLRKQLLGRNYDKVMKAAAANKASTGKSGAASQVGKAGASAGTSGLDEGSDDDEEEGRSAMVGKKRKKGNDSGMTRPVVAAEETSAVEQAGVVNEAGSTNEMPAKSAPTKGRKKATSYLDELLAERSKKRKKR